MSKRDMGKEFIAHITEGLSRKDVQAGIIKGKIASAILIKRCELGMNQTTFARYMGVSQAMVSKWESGECNFTIAAISEISEKLSLIFDVSLTKEADYMQASRNNSWSGLSKDKTERINNNDIVSYDHWLKKSA